MAAVAAVAAVIVGIRSCSYSSSNYEAQNRPQLQTGNYSSDADDLFSWQVWNSGNEDARDIRFKFAGIDSGMHSATPLTPESASLWPRLPKFGTYENDWVKIRVSRSNFPYLLVCVDYKGERSQPFPADDNFLALADWRPNMANLTSPPRPALAEADKLRAKFSCATL